MRGVSDLHSIRGVTVSLTAADRRVQGYRFLGSNATSTEHTVTVNGHAAVAGDLSAVLLVNY